VTVAEAAVAVVMMAVTTSHRREPDQAGGTDEESEHWEVPFCMPREPRSGQSERSHAASIRASGPNVKAVAAPA
jgi:hypothetical protein